MNGAERKKFWDVLIGLDGKKPEQDKEKLHAAVKFPEHIYRYRAVNTNTLSALQKNRLFFSTSNYYDDPFDTFLHIDFTQIDSMMDSMEQAEPENLKQGIEAFGKAFCLSNIENLWQKIQSCHWDEIRKNLKGYIENVRSEMRKEIWSACFSENGTNETLWLKYADNHKGFVLDYDLHDDARYLCGSREKCKICPIYQFGIPIYPVYYSDEMYDATEYAQFVTMQSFVSMLPDSCSAMRNMLQMKNTYPAWSKEKASLIKKKCHEYDEEWRIVMALTLPEQSSLQCRWIPSRVILGLRMDTGTKAVVASLAKEAGIPLIEECYIKEDKLGTRPYNWVKESLQ